MLGFHIDSWRGFAAAHVWRIPVWICLLLILIIGQAHAQTNCPSNCPPRTPVNTPLTCPPICPGSQDIKEAIECSNGCFFPEDRSFVSSSQVCDAHVPFEGNVPYMYCDSVGVVTVGIGNALFGSGQAASLGFTRADGTLATPDEIIAEYNRVQGLCGCTPHPQCYQGSLTLGADIIQQLCIEYVDGDREHLQRIFPRFHEFPASVQLALFDMIYNLGPGGVENTFVSFTEAIRDQDWARAACHSCRFQIQQSRNDYVRQLLEAAAQEAAEAQDRLLLQCS